MLELWYGINRSYSYIMELLICVLILGKPARRINMVLSVDLPLDPKTTITGDLNSVVNSKDTWYS